MRLPTLENTECKIMGQFSLTALSTFKRGYIKFKFEKKKNRDKEYTVNIIALYKKWNNIQKKNVSLTLYKYINRENILYNSTQRKKIN